MLETVPLELIPPTHSVHVAFYRNVRNAAKLQSHLLARNADFEYAFVDASVVVSRIHLLSAAFKALTAQLAGSLKTPNVHSELVASLSPSHNVCHFAPVILSLPDSSRQGKKEEKKICKYNQLTSGSNETDCRCIPPLRHRSRY